ncbi:MAG: glutamate--tRNA ligase [Chthoniobacter sp.]|nr:glutamate--tRNA ligase [Chthoniobacter sp.]
MNPEIRVRFAPSPTGYLHVGGARTALFNWLFARHHGGKFILRIEDTDRARHHEDAVQVIYDGLRWLGLDWDEGPHADGPHGPYFQSKRETIYQRYADQLIAAGRVYADENGALRFRLPRQPLAFDDMVCGRIEVDRSKSQNREGELEADMTIRRADGGWIFHFVNVVDDIDMRITHVIRGEDHLSNTAKHIELYQALGVEPPRFGHIPLILNKDGSKMSKRDTGASITSYLDGGYVPEAVLNYFCLLGWSPKDDREIMPREEIVARFDLANVNRKGAHFDLAKCDWFNAQYLQQMPLERYRELSAPWLAKAGVALPAGQLDAVLALEKMKVTHLTEVPERVAFFATEDFPYEPVAVEKTLGKPGALDRLAQLAECYAGVEPFDAVTLEAKLKELATTLAVKPAEFIHPARVAVSGRSVGPSLYHMLEVLGKERALARIARTRREFAA